MKYYYFLTLFSFFVITSQGQEKNSSLIHVQKERLATFEIATPDKKSSEATDKEESLEEETEHFINFNPVMHFGGQESRLDISRQLGDISKITIFTVYKSKDQLAERAIWELYGASSYTKLTTGRAFNSDRSSPYTGGLTDTPVLSTYTHAYKPRNKNKSGVKQRLILGGSSDKNMLPFQGDIAEVVVYNRVLKGVAREKIESALALKYGITLRNGKNYIASDGTVIWNAEEQEEFTHRIAGIGRDDDSKLYQKQAQSTSDPGLLIIGAGEIALANTENTASFEDGSFLVWGDNNRPLILEPGGQVQDRVSLLQRRWLMQQTGDHTKEAISTTVQLDINSLFEKAEDPGNYLLVIDESATGDFLVENTRYVRGDLLLENGKIEFKNVQWDKDGSGGDLFSFTIISDLNAELVAIAPENCDALHNGTLQYTVSGGVAPYTYKLSAETTGYSEQWASAEEKYPDNRIKDLAGANYEFTVTDAMGHEVTAVYTLENPVPITVDLGPDRKLTTAAPLYLDATVNQEEGTTYRWTSDNGFSSDLGSIYIDTPGTYQVIATSPLGCTASDEIVISDRFVQSFSLYPNQSKDGYYQLQIILEEPSDVLIGVFDTTGRLIHTMKGENQVTYDFSGHISAGTGIYTIVVETRGETISKKLIVE